MGANGWAARGLDNHELYEKLSPLYKDIVLCLTNPEHVIILFDRKTHL